MGIVYLAHDPGLDRQVAVKILKGTFDQARLIREGKALAKLAHENVVTVYDVGERDGHAWLSMEYLTGVTLDVWLKPEGRSRSWNEVLRVMLAAGRGVAAAHRADLIHRDLKPSNLFIGGDGRARVVDFGLVKTTNPGNFDEKAVAGARVDASAPFTTLTPPGMAPGTPAYMSPEQSRGLALDARSDQYSFCAVLWYALHGTRPFSEQSTGTPRSSRSCNRRSMPSVPTWLNRILTRGLATDPNKRWPTMDALLAALESGTARRRRAWLAISVGVVMLGLLISWGMLRWDRARRVAMCAARGGEISAVWNAETKVAIRHALTSTGVGFAASTYDQVVSHFDQWAGDWSSKRVQACLEGEVEGTQSVELYDRSKACFSERREEFGALVALLRSADRIVARRAAPAAAEFPGLQSCVEKSALELRPAPPRDPAMRVNVTDVRQELMQMRALEFAGKYNSALEGTELLLIAATKVGHEPLIVETGLLVGKLASRVGRLDRAVQVLSRVYVQAGTLGLDEFAAWAAIELVDTTGHVQSKYSHGWLWAQSAELFVGRLDLNDKFIHGILLQNLASIATDEGKFEEAYELDKKALDITMGTLGPNHPGVAIGYANLAGSLRGLGRLDEAQALAEQSLATYETSVGKNHPLNATALMTLGNIQQERADYESALSYFERALQIEQDAGFTDSPKFADQMNSAGNACKRLGRYDQARMYYQNALDLREQLFGSENADVAATLDALGTLYAEQGDALQARALYERALRIMEKVGGVYHQSLGNVLSNLANLLESQGEYAAAAAYCDRALVIYKNLLGANHSRYGIALGNCAYIHYRQRAYLKARQNYNQALDIQTATLGSEHPTVAATLDDIAVLDQEQGFYEEAQRRLERSVAVIERALRPNHPRIFLPLLHLGINAVHRARPAEAVTTLERAFAIRDPSFATPREIGLGKFALARALGSLPVNRGGDRVRARALAVEARDLLAAAKGGSSGARTNVERWLRSHPAATARRKVR